MKIIGIRNGDGRELPQQVYLMADSAVIRTNKPFFLPHFAQSFTGRPALALHIDRLGKHIAPRFAHRYCLAVAPAIKVSASGIDVAQESQQHSALAHSFDGALLLGDFSAIDNTTGINATQVVVERNGEQAGGGSLEITGIDYRELISQLSTYFTLKMGDMIVVELNTGNIDLTIGDTLTASCDGSKKLVIRVK